MSSLAPFAPDYFAKLIFFLVLMSFLVHCDLWNMSRSIRDAMLDVTPTRTCMPPNQHSFMFWRWTWCRFCIFPIYINLCDLWALLVPSCWGSLNQGILLHVKCLWIWFCILFQCVWGRWLAGCWEWALRTKWICLDPGTAPCLLLAPCLHDEKTRTLGTGMRSTVYWLLACSCLKDALISCDQFRNSCEYQTQLTRLQDAVGNATFTVSGSVSAAVRVWNQELTLFLSEIKQASLLCLKKTRKDCRK